jgi:hypothetical protein
MRKTFVELLRSRLGPDSLDESGYRDWRLQRLEVKGTENG